MTIRAPDDLVARVKQRAAELGRSMNDYVVSVLAAATDPDLSGDEVERVRERLARAGLLHAGTGRPPAGRIPEAELAQARRAAGHGRALSEYVTNGR
jgi:plasmid stability protein